MSKPQQDVIAALRIENEELKAALAKARGHVWRIFSHYSTAEIARVTESNNGSQLCSYGLALRVIDDALKEKP